VSGHAQLQKKKAKEYKKKKKNRAKITFPQRNRIAVSCIIYEEGVRVLERRRMLRNREKRGRYIFGSPLQKFNEHHCKSTELIPILMPRVAPKPIQQVSLILNTFSGTCREF
jgi:hypothetical protein